jgi:hypothetical protein
MKRCEYNRMYYGVGRQLCDHELAEIVLSNGMDCLGDRVGTGDERCPLNAEFKYGVVDKQQTTRKV